jgi:Tfp pilus assembly protein PilN
LKPIHLNLAARPYRDYRPVYAVVVVASLLIALMMLNNVETYVRYVSETRVTRAKIAALEAEGAKEKQRADDAQRRLKTINVAALDKQTRFINAQIAERAFSWSELLDRLEGILTSDTRITNIAPSFGKDEKDPAAQIVHLELTCEAKTPQGMTTMLERFQQDPQFQRPFPHVENAAPTGYQFSIGVEYIPSQPKVVTR